MTMSIAEATAILTAPGQMFELGEATVRGLPLKVWKNAPPSLRGVLELSRGHGDQAFLVYEDERMTFEEHFRAAAHLARRLIEDYGVAKGDRVAIAMRNFPEWAIAFWATAVAGAVVVPLNAWWTGDELAYGLADSGATVLFADAEREARLKPHWDECTNLHAVIVARSETGVDEGHARFEDILGHIPDAASLPDVDLQPDDD